MTHDANSSKFSFNILINGVLISSNLVPATIIISQAQDFKFPLFILQV